MADPFDVLGLAPGASLDDAEEAYHHRLLRCHPDLHASEGPDAVARAETETRDLNEAIDRIRHGWRPSPGATGSGSTSPGSTSSGSAGSRASARSTTPGFGMGPPSGAGAPGGFGQGTRSGSRSRFSGRVREEPWPAGADRARDHRPVACPFCGHPVTNLAEFEEHLARRHPTQDRSRRKASRRHARAQRWWWPVPLWLFAVIDAAAVGLMILVVAATGGHWALVDRVLGDDAPRRCVRGELVYTRFGTERCNPDNWPVFYLAFGVIVFIAFAVYRWTTTKRD